ncbi:MAG: Glu/Leu/Phe/Val dehydrogenase family protein, partial [Pseudomonadota bacterium]|nr:Glu/Leu/Phe/Val dehydrogenase family protein [Pseudomonadota bacterium]
AEVTEFVAGLNGGKFSSGDPSPYTAQGVFNCMEVTWSHRHDGKSLNNVTVAIQGLGHVGMHLARKLYGVGARLIVCDLDETQTERAKSEYSAKVVPPSEIHKQDADIFAPCAMGGALTNRLVHELKAKVVVGAANNQLANSTVGEQLKKRGILYAPDYIVNGGGIVNAAMEILKVSDPSFRASRLNALTATLREILAEADATGKLPHVLADEMMERRLSAA